MIVNVPECFPPIQFYHPTVADSAHVSRHVRQSGTKEDGHVQQQHLHLELYVAAQCASCGSRVDGHVTRSWRTVLLSQAICPQIVRPQVIGPQVQCMW